MEEVGLDLGAVVEHMPRHLRGPGFEYRPQDNQLFFFLYFLSSLKRTSVRRLLIFLRKKMRIWATFGQKTLSMHKA